MNFSNCGDCFFSRAFSELPSLNLSFLERSFSIETEKMNSKSSVCYTASSLLISLIYHIIFVKITNCYESGVLPRVTVLSSQTLDLSQWRANLDIDVVKFPAGNLSFYDALKVAETISRTVQEGNGTKAIIGSGNKFIDRLIAGTLGLLVVPFISILRQDEYQVFKENPFIIY